MSTKEALSRIIDLRRSFMTKRWEKSFIKVFKTKIEVWFSNGGGDFRSMAYPTMEEAYKDQVRKLKRDATDAVDKDFATSLIKMHG
jgi:hypothetical protein